MDLKVIFPYAQCGSHLAKRISDLKQNGTQKRHHFVAQVSIPFHMVSSVLLRVLASETTEWLPDWLSKNFNQSEGGFLS